MKAPRVDETRPAGRQPVTTLCLVTLFACLGLAVVSTGLEASTEGIEIDDELVLQLQEDESTGYAIFFRERPDLSPAYEMDWIERGRFVVGALRAAAESSQPAVRQYLRDSGAAFKSFWIDNVIVVESSDASTFSGLVEFDEIAALRADPDMRLIEPESLGAAGVGPLAVEPNISHVNAPAVWALGFEGQGVVVANIDTGARYTHQALVGQYRGNLGGGSFDHNHNWWDPPAGSSAPVDGNGHGTHTMGTAVGDDGGANEIGMAPEASWIACRGCPGTSCPGDALLECAEFMAAPWDLNQQNADPDRRPHVVNNSWGNCERFYNPWYQGVVDAWHAAGIVPVFANGNASNCGFPSDPPCNTVGNPARYGNVLGVGSTGTNNGQYALHSNKGPTDNPWDENPLGFPTIKPNLAAPGVFIRSSDSLSDTAYAFGTGTSMSAPHVAGMVALLWQAASCLVGDYVATAAILMDSSTAIPFASNCGGEGPGNVPNHATGWGELDALAIVDAGIAFCDNGEPPTDITLAADGRRVQGMHVVDLEWQGASSADIDAYRDGQLITTVPNSGAHTDPTGNRGRASYTYQVCEAGTSECSNEATVTFGGPRS